jgi:hypothetical protein
MPFATAESCALVDLMFFLVEVIFFLESETEDAVQSDG